jgi:succinate dehydrogenase / fumarate reductase membrane anchor subunit
MAASSRSGLAHWWAQRTSAIALVPLSLWFVAALVAHTGASHADVVAWLGAPLPAILTTLMIAATFYHAMLGLEVVIEDYVHDAGMRIASILVVRFGCIGFAVAGVFAVLRIAFSS